MDFANRSTTFRRRFGAASLAVAAVTFVTAELIDPTEGKDPVADLAAEAAHHGRYLLFIGLGVLSSLLFVPALFALMTPVRRRGTVLTHLGGGLALLGVGLSGLVLAGVDFFFYEASAPGVDRAAVGHFITQATHDPVAAPMLAGHYLFVLGLILLGFGLYRARVGARWAALCLAAGPVLDAVLSTVIPAGTDAGELITDVVSDGTFLAGVAGLAWWLVTTSNAAWEGLAPAGDDERVAQPVGASV